MLCKLITGKRSHSSTSNSNVVKKLLLCRNQQCCTNLGSDTQGGGAHSFRGGCQVLAQHRVGRGKWLHSNDSGRMRAYKPSRVRPNISF